METVAENFATIEATAATMIAWIELYLIWVRVRLETIAAHATDQRT